MAINQRGFSWIMVLIVVAVVLLGFYYFYNSKPQESTTNTNSTPAITSSSPQGLETEANSIKLESVESGFVEIDSDLKELK